MTADALMVRDVLDLGPIEYSGERIAPTKIVALGAEILQKVGASATLVNLPGVAQGVIDCVADALKIRLTEICVEAWNKRDEIRRLDSDAESKSTTPRLVTLAKHTVEWQYKPVVTLRSNGVHLASLEFIAAIALTFDALTLTVQHGRLQRIATGTGTVGASLHCETLELVNRKTAPHRLPGTIDFDGGLPLGASRQLDTALAGIAH